MLANATLSIFVSAALLLGPPSADTNRVVENLHGVRVADDFRWLEALESESEAVEEWTTHQNDYTRSVLDHLPGREALEQRLAELMTLPSITAPAMRQNRYFYRKRQGEENQAVLYMREG